MIPWLLVGGAVLAVGAVLSSSSDSDKTNQDTKRQSSATGKSLSDLQQIPESNVPAYIRKRLKK